MENSVLEFDSSIQVYTRKIEKSNRIKLKCRMNVWFYS